MPLSRDCVVYCILSITLLFNINKSIAQEYLLEIGPTGGANYYSGDVNQRLFQNIGYEFGITLKYNINLRNVVKLNVNREQIRSKSETGINIFPYHPYSFERSFIEISSGYEYNFFSYSDLYEYNESKRWTPYIYIGVGYLYSSNGKNLDQINALTLPLGIGFKYKIKNRVNLGIEYSMTWCSNDKLDGLKDPYQIQSSKFKNKDWISSLRVFITYDFCKKKCNCPRDYK